MKRSILAEKGRLQVAEYDWETVSSRELLFMKKLVRVENGKPIKPDSLIDR